MARNTEEILMGVGTVYTAPVGTAFPADPTAAVGGSWLEIGYTEEGWHLSVERDTEDIDVAEEIDPVDIVATSRESHWVGNSVQGSLENLKLALGGGTITTVAGPPARKEFVPSGTDVLDRVAVLFRGKAPSVAGVAKVRQIDIPVTVPVGAVEIASRKAPAKTSIAMDFRIVKATGEDFFKITDLT